MIAIVDYGMGNLRSVAKAFEKIGYGVSVTRDPREIATSNALVLPGVGAFGDCVKNLRNLGLVEPIISHIESKKPYLGICLGLQVLFEGSQESPGVSGLGVLEGEVVRFDLDSAELKIPHMGWNTVSYRRASPLFGGIPDRSRFYFVHSYYAVPKEEGVVLGLTDYGVEFASAVGWDRVFALQFHPEKSATLGLRILDNFARIAGESRVALAG